MTYANHGATENTEERTEILTIPRVLSGVSVLSVTLWLAYVDEWRMCGT